jgi:acyl carrier protein
LNPRSAVRDFVSNLLHKAGDQQPFIDSDSLILSGRLQSIDALELIIFLEGKYGVDFADRPFDQGQIDSIDDVMTLLAETAGLPEASGTRGK